MKMVEEQLDHPSFEKKPFERKHLDTAQDIVSIRLNPEERAMLQKVKSLMWYDADATVLKLGLETLHNVIQSTFGERVISQICSPRRKRYNG